MIVIVFVKALVRFLGEAHRGVRGFVTDRSGRPLENVAIKVKGRDAPFQTTKHGEFWRILLPGYYRIEVFFYNYFYQNLKIISHNKRDDNFLTN